MLDKFMVFLDFLKMGLWLVFSIFPMGNSLWGIYHEDIRQETAGWLRNPAVGSH
jgi:hypothetical protein